MFFAVTPTPTPTPSGGSGPVPSGSFALDVDLVLLLVAVIIIAWALGQLSLIIFKAIRGARQRAQREKEKHLDDDSFD